MTPEDFDLALEAARGGMFSAAQLGVTAPPVPGWQMGPGGVSAVPPPALKSSLPAPGAIRLPMLGPRRPKPRPQPPAAPPFSDPMVGGGWQYSGPAGPMTQPPATPAAPAQPQSPEAILALGHQAASAARATGEAEAAAGRVKAQGLDEAAGTAQQAQAATGQAVDTAEADIAAMKARHQEALRKYESAPLTDYWADKSTGEKIAAAIFTGFGAAGAALTGGRNGALDIINGAMENDRQIKLDRIARLKDSVVQAEAGVRDATLARGRLVENALLREAAAGKTIAARAAAREVQAGVPVETAKNDERVIAIETKAMEAYQRAVEQAQRNRLLEIGIREHAAARAKKGGGGAGGGRNVDYRSEVTGKPATEPERDADSYAQRMTSQLNVIRSLPPLSQKDAQTIRQFYIENQGPLGSGFIGGIANWTGLRKTLQERLSPQGRAFWQGLGEFAAANLRKESGAAISAEEYRQAFERFAPVVGDSQADAGRKIQAMQGVALNAGRKSFRPSYWEAQIAGGEAAEKPVRRTAPSGVAPSTPSTQAAPTTTGGKRVRLKSGETGLLAPDGTFTPDN